ncbi:LysR substrate-binding domain-containing protein [Actomonas aquatica]|uniref:LysR substrate-binding domain-containing protein n=1 Tax=Actomonas aquatica TaxID=2866162 RepID=A0ABZ1C744_9BACT|nr:LysR substrate-binding domain-containing protein [Opitutus sp. WL0086]WRQ87286.1 LysR substrate-binding domain-containing protein [Opitutus sp. WL0086]
MELRHLRYFVAVAEELNFRRAAERVRVAQPALSKQIKDLEHEIGVVLLERSTTRVELTDGGRVMLDEARELLAAAERAVEATRQAAEGRAGRLAVGNVNAICASFMPATLSTFHNRFPEVDVDLLEVTLADHLGAVEQGEVSVGFVVDDGEFAHEQFDTMKVLTGDIQVAMGRGHRLATQRRVSIAELAEERILCIETGGRELHRRRIRDIFAKRRARPGRFKAVNSYESLQAMIEGEQGVSFLAAMPSSGGHRNVIYRPLKEEGDDLHFDLLAVWRRHNVSKLAANFVAVLQEVCAPRVRTRKSV